MAHSYGENVFPLVFLVKSSDLVHWTPMGSLRLATDAENNFIDCPQWIVDPAGNVRLIACVDNHHHWVDIHPLRQDPETWGNQANWSEITTFTDHNGKALIQGNSFVALQNGTYYMAFNDIRSTVYYMRTSTDLTSGWSEARQLNLDSTVNRGDSLNLVFLSDGTLRYYISNGNSIKYVIWHVDSPDLGITWTAPEVLSVDGFKPPGINWVEVVRLTNTDAITAIVAAGG